MPRTVVLTDKSVDVIRLRAPVQTQQQFNVLLRMVKSIHLSDAPLLQFRPHSYEECLCLLGGQLARWFSGTHDAAGRWTCDHQSGKCLPPACPTADLQHMLEQNHMLQSILVGMDPVVDIVELELRRATQAAAPRFLFQDVFALFLVRMTERVARIHAFLGIVSVHKSELPYALQPVTVTWVGFHRSRADRGWSRRMFTIPFPARQVHAAFLANRSLWLKLVHPPVFEPPDVSARFAQRQAQSPQEHQFVFKSPSP